MNMQLRYPFFWDMTPYQWVIILVISLRRFEITPWSHLQGSNCPTFRPFKMKATGSFKTSGTSHPVMRRHIPEGEDNRTVAKALELATEGHVSLFSAPASCSRASDSSLAPKQTIWNDVFAVFLSHHMYRLWFNIGHDRFLSHSFQFVIH